MKKYNKITIAVTIIIAMVMQVGYCSERQVVVDLNDLTITSGITKDEAESLMPEGMKGWGSYFYEAENKYNINAIVLIAITRLESGNGTNALTLKKNNPTSYGMSWGGEKFDSVRDCILRTAKLLSEEYLTPGGKFYNGKSLSQVGTKYCTGNTWKTKVTEVIVKM